MRISDWSADVCSSDLLLVDDDIVSIGTANLDNRSFRLNFELSIVVADRPFSAAVEAMLREDFALSRRVAPGELDERSFWFRFGVRSEEHTSELQSLMRISYAVFCLKKKQIQYTCNDLTLELSRHQ